MQQNPSEPNSTAEFIVKLFAVLVFLINSWPLFLLISPLFLELWSGHHDALLPHPSFGWLISLFLLTYPLIYAACIRLFLRSLKQQRLRLALAYVFATFVYTLPLLILLFPLL